MPGIFNARADEALYAASCHSFGKATRNQRFQHPGLPAMTPDQRDAFVDDSISRFITGSMDAAPGTRIGAFTTADAIAQPGIGTYSVFADAKYSDESWRAAFSPVELTAGTDTWEIHQIDNPVTWQKIGEGGQVRAQSLTSEKATYGVDDYATELAFTYRMMRGRVLYQFIAALNLARDSYLATLSEAHYAVLATASITGTGAQVAWQGVSADSQIDRDIATINAGLSKIATDLKDVGTRADERPVSAIRTRGAGRARHRNATRPYCGPGKRAQRWDRWPAGQTVAGHSADSLGSGARQQGAARVSGPQAAGSQRRDRPGHVQ